MSDSGRQYHIEFPALRLDDAVAQGAEIQAQVREYGRLIRELHVNTRHNLERLATVINGGLGAGNLDMAGLVAALEIPEDQVIFDPAAGHNHDGNNSRAVLGQTEVVEFSGVRTITGQLVSEGMRCIQVWLKRGRQYRLMLPVWIDRYDETRRRMLTWFPWVALNPALLMLALAGGVRFGTAYGVGTQYPVVEQDGAGNYTVDLGTTRTGRLVAT